MCDCARFFKEAAQKASKESPRAVHPWEIAEKGPARRRALRCLCVTPAG
jgi:hypothetical protein